MKVIDLININMRNVIDKIIFTYLNNKSLYIGEKITMSEHMIQTAMLAEKTNCSTNLVCASLLHDYGHFILENPSDLVDKNKDGRHEKVGYQYLKKFFIKDVLEPIKHHVKAKRYLARESKYFNLLSKASKTSLKLQGGIMNNDEAEEFESNKFFEDSIKLRKFDEMAKRTDIIIKHINEYKNLLISKLI